jgi:hypothetical protein
VIHLSRTACLWYFNGNLDNGKVLVNRGSHLLNNVALFYYLGLFSAQFQVVPRILINLISRIYEAGKGEVRRKFSKFCSDRIGHMTINGVDGVCHHCRAAVKSKSSTCLMSNKSISLSRFETARAG